MKRELEALLFATDSPLSAGRLKKIFRDVSTADLKQQIEELEADYTAAGNAFTIVEFGGGWQIATRPEYSPLVESLLKTRKYARLSRAGLEVLAIIAYRQPITRLEIDEIRGVQSSGALLTLQDRNLITVVGRSESVGHPLLYGTTREFLGHLGLRGLSQLPDLPTIEEVVENRDDLRAFAAQFGEELTDADFDGMREPEPDEIDEIEDADVTADDAQEPAAAEANGTAEQLPETPDPEVDDDDAEATDRS